MGQMRSKQNWQKWTDGELDSGKSVLGIGYNVFMAILVLTVCITFIIETYPISEQTRTFCETLDWGITWVFLCDYILRFWAKGFSVRYLFTQMALIDFISILPLFISAQWQFVRILRLFRILRLIRIFQKGSFLFFKITEVHLRQIKLFFSLFCIIFISSGVIYDIEFRGDIIQNRTFFDALYFTVVTLTTVGYGDIIPISDLGKMVTLLMIITGAVLIPWQISGLARYFIEERQKIERRCTGCRLKSHDKNAKFCKRCGSEL